MQNSEMKCIYCIDPATIIHRETCCTGCSVLKQQEQKMFLSKEETQHLLQILDDELDKVNYYDKNLYEKLKNHLERITQDF